MYHTTFIIATKLSIYGESLQYSSNNRTATCLMVCDICGTHNGYDEMRVIFKYFNFLQFLSTLILHLV